MKYSARLAAVFSILPTIVFAHPGHFDDSQLAHELSHAAFYLIGFAALCILAGQHGRRVMRLFADRMRSRR